MNASEYTVHNDGIRLVVQRFGGDGPALLLCHATGFCAMAYRALAESLTDRFTVYAMDFRGHGFSDKPTSEAEFVWSRMATDVRAVAESIDADDLFVFGHSMGGACSFQCELDNPGSFAGMFVFEPIVPTPAIAASEFVTASPLERTARKRRRRFDSKTEAIERYGARPPLNLFRADILHDYVEHGFVAVDDGIELRCLPEHEAATFAGAGIVTTETIRAIDIPVVVAASGDGDFPAEMAPVVASSLRHGTTARFDSLTHFGPMQDPAAVADAVVNALL